MTLSDIYRNLFGKDHLQDGNAIDLAEHGRSGGVSTGQGFKFTKDVPEKTLIDESISGVTFIGSALPGTATTTDAWLIKRITESGTDTLIEYPSGIAEYNTAWVSRASLSYS